jgi:hypothetical protein
MNKDQKRHRRKMAALKRRIKRVNKSANRPRHRPSIDTEVVAGFDKTLWSRLPTTEVKPSQPSLSYFDTAAWNRHDQNSK